MRISRENFADFLNAKRAGTYKCAFCGTETFAVNSVLNPPHGNEGVGTVDDDAALPARLDIPAVNTDDPKDVGEHPFYSISCTNCGFGTFFHQNQIAAWLSSREEEENDV